MSFAIINKAIGLAGKLASKVAPYVPTIGVVGGSIGVIAGTIMACKATLELDDVIAEHNALMSHIDVHGSEKMALGKYTEEQMNCDKLRVRLATVGKIIKVYTPSAALIIGGFAAIFGGFGLIRKWHGIAVGALSTLDSNFRTYRRNVIDNYGEDVDSRMLNPAAYDAEHNALEAQKIGEASEHTDEIKRVDTDSLSSEEKDIIVEIRDAMEDDYVKLFDSRSEAWSNNYIFNDNYIWSIEQEMTKALQSGRKNAYFLNEQYRPFGFEETEFGHCYGITNKPGAEINFDATPYILDIYDDGDGRYAIIHPFATYKDEFGHVRFINDDDQKVFRDMYAMDDNRVGYIIHFNSDTDENGNPKVIMSKAFTKK